MNKVAALTDKKEKVSSPLIDRHMDIPCFRDLYFDTRVQQVASELLGTDLFLWRTNFFVKSEGVGENKWHHDRQFENGNAAINIFDTSNHFTILVALTDIDMNAGRIEYLRGSHLPIDGFDRDIPRHFLDAPEVVQDRITPLPLERGQFAIFHSGLLHRSLAFGEGEGRISLAARLARKGTEFPDYGAVNPAGGAQTEAEPRIYFRTSGVLPFNYTA